MDGEGIGAVAIETEASLGAEPTLLSFQIGLPFSEFVSGCAGKLFRMDLHSQAINSCFRVSIIVSAQSVVSI